MPHLPVNPDSRCACDSKFWRHLPQCLRTALPFDSPLFQNKAFFWYSRYSPFFCSEVFVLCLFLKTNLLFSFSLFFYAKVLLFRCDLFFFQENLLLFHSPHFSPIPSNSSVRRPFVVKLPPFLIQSLLCCSTHSFSNVGSWHPFQQCILLQCVFEMWLRGVVDGCPAGKCVFEYVKVWPPNTIWFYRAGPQILRVTIQKTKSKSGIARCQKQAVKTQNVLAHMTSRMIVVHSIKCRSHIIKWSQSHSITRPVNHFYFPLQTCSDLAQLQSTDSFQ